MTRTRRIAAVIAAAFGLTIATAAVAQPGWYGGGPCAMQGAQATGYVPGAGQGPGWMGRGGGYGPGAMMRSGYGPGAGMGPGYGPRASMGPGVGPRAGMGPGFGGRGLAAQVMTPEELTAHREKMASAATPEERQQIAATHFAEVQKRAAEKGVAVPQRGPRGGYGPGFGRGQQAPAETQQ